MHLWAGTSTKVAAAAAGFSDAVYNKTVLPAGVMEAARVTIARINDCQVCRSMRVDDGPAESFYDALLTGRPGEAGLSEPEALAAEFADRFATDHLGIDDDLWVRLHASYTDDELFELALCIGSWLALGRINRVFDVDGACRIPDAHVGGRVSG